MQKWTLKYKKNDLTGKRERTGDNKKRRQQKEQKTKGQRITMGGKQSIILGFISPVHISEGKNVLTNGLKQENLSQKIQLQEMGSNFSVQSTWPRWKQSRTMNQSIDRSKKKKKSFKKDGEVEGMNEQPIAQVVYRERNFQKKD